MRLRLTAFGARHIDQCRGWKLGATAARQGSIKTPSRLRDRLTVDDPDCAPSVPAPGNSGGGNAPTDPDPPPPPPPEPPRPNVLLILTDDQPAGHSMEVMPETRAVFAQNGTEFSRAYGTTPLCCPGRASIYSGKYPHNHGVHTVGNHPSGGKAFDASDSWQRQLDDLGYFTGLLGKYFVALPATQAPYFDRRVTIVPDSDDPVEMAEEADKFLDEAETADEVPWALVLSTTQPHGPWDGEPAVPSPLPEWQPPPSFLEEDLSDKHPAVAEDAARYIRFGPDFPEFVRTGQLKEIQQVDEMVGKVMSTLDSLDEKEDTLAIFTSDNGYMWGQHSLYHKTWPYIDSIQIPLYLSWPGHIDSGAVDDRLVANIDIAPTIQDALQIESEYPVDGRSLLSGFDRPSLLLEGPLDTSGRIPLWNAMLSDERHYVSWDDGFVEDYNLPADPYEMTAANIPDPGAEAAIQAALECVGSSCP